MKGNVANKNVLKKYLYNVYNLEVSLYNQKNLKNEIIHNIQYLNSKNYEAYYAEESTDRIKEDVWEGEMFNAGFGFIGGGVILSLIIRGIYSCKDGGIFAELFTGRLFGWLFQFALIGAVVGLVLFCVITLIQYLVIRKRINAQNKEIELLNDKIDTNNRKERETDIQKIKILKNTLLRQEASITKTTAVLNKYYSYNIIFPKYRYLEAVSSFYEYFASGRCSTLEGHEGAYNIFENELRQGLIINKLDDIIDHLERIEDSQYMLYTAIQKGNEETARISAEINTTANKLNQIESNTAVTAYYSRIGAENTECLKWIEIFNR